MGISNAQYLDIMYQYDQTRLKNQRILDERYNEIYDKIPEMKHIQDEIIQLSANQARFELLHPDETDQTLSIYMQKKKNLQEKKAKTLEANGYPANYLSPIYKCKSCKDTGYIDNEPCNCLKQRRIALLYKNSNLMDILKSENFDTFSAEYYDDENINKNLSLTPRQNIIKIRDICLNYVNNFDEAYSNMIFYGPTGVGKTFMTHCIAKALLDTSHTVVYLTSLQLFDILEKNKFDKSDESTTLSEQVSYILKSELLIIDDLGTELVNSFTASQLYQFIEERHLNRRATIISTNLSFHELRDRYSERIFSRFTGYYDFYMLVGDDIRIKIAIS